jgi:methylthioribose-1-phosphate isomerase
MPTAPKSTEQKPLPDLSSMGLRVEGNTLLILDQTRLPEEENWVTVESPEHMVAIIKDLKVRGAPLIGVAAAVSLANFAQKTNANSSEVMTAATALRNSRPTAVNLMNALDRMLKSKNLTETATEIFYEDVRCTCQ